MEANDQLNANLASVLGHYCGFRWAIECRSKILRNYFTRHRASVPSFYELCYRVSPPFGKVPKGMPDRLHVPEVAEKLFVQYARGLGIEHSKLEERAEFLGGFCAGANEGFAVRSQMDETEDEPLAEVDIRYCPHCDEDVEPKDSRCPKCGGIIA
jgi:hypothetical protein